ncbi:MAG: hypothetical protein Tsb0016_08490 [Sphingomonadales bacterium]
MRALVQSLLILAGVTALYLAYFWVEREFGASAKTGFVAVLAVAVMVFLLIRRQWGNKR